MEPKGGSKKSVGFLILNYAICLRIDNISTEIVENRNLRCKQKRGGKAEDIEEALLEWFRKTKLKIVPISCGILYVKAKQFAQMMYVENLNPTNDQLTRWKKRNNIVYHKFHGEKQDVDFDAADNRITTILPQL